MAAGVSASLTGLVEGAQDLLVWLSYHLFAVLLAGVVLAGAAIAGLRVYRRREGKRKEDDVPEDRTD